MAMRSAKCFQHIGADFEGIRANRRTKPGDEIAGVRTEAPHLVDGALEDARCEAAPSRVRDADHSPATIRQQNGQAVSGQHCANNAGLAGDGGVRDGGEAVLMRPMDDHRGTMNLVQPTRLRGKKRAQPAAIFGNGFVGITSIFPKIHRRQCTDADAPITCRQDRLHAAWCRPFGHDPVESRGFDPLREGERSLGAHGTRD